MKYTISLACIIGGVVLAYNGSDSWGWLIFIAIILEMNRE